ncbi:AzlD domain-containing protein [Pseudalkalibacillus sp. SCS-8]|uniref:AzlD domain-containing protein n=1 Tax=Pseudalkalibacillus nanhaiensis TaxID=3115291 RepID=UPI0032D9DD7F
MSETYIWIILGMAIVTYIPRMLPLVALNTESIPPFLRGVLKNVPFAILGALIFPGILTFNGDMWMGVVGAVTAFIAAYFGASLIVIVICSISVLSVLSLLFT